jgi:hypothetical protein
MAQVYSVNAVGYVNKTVGANSYCIFANPLNGTNNSLNTILALPNGYDGATIYRFSPSLQQYLDPIAWIEGFGWFSPTDPDPTLNPGEGFFFQNVAAQPLNITFVGEVPSGTLNNPVAGGGRYSIRSSIVPKGLRLGDTDPTTGGAVTLDFSADDGDTVYTFNCATQQYNDPYAYIGGFGWFSNSDPDPDGPLIDPGSGFWIQKTAPDRVWTQSFSVN